MKNLPFITCLLAFVLSSCNKHSKSINPRSATVLGNASSYFSVKDKSLNLFFDEEKGHLVGNMKLDVIKKYSTDRALSFSAVLYNSNNKVLDTIWGVQRGIINSTLNAGTGEVNVELYNDKYKIHYYKYKDLKDTALADLMENVASFQVKGAVE